MRRPVGRPRGSGPKQRAALESEANGTSTSPPNKRPVGRPRKVVTHGLCASKRAISGLHVPGSRVKFPEHYQSLTIHLPYYYSSLLSSLLRALPLRCPILDNTDWGCLRTSHPRHLNH
ncbi:hypothetical protein L208DRAFT_908538 [Tricholoma matsutake]|nr:hypothetical protein L208DRAFT_908538 [Tricholoma matsutake 945]